MTAAVSSHKEAGTSQRFREFSNIYVWSMKKNIGVLALLTVLLFLAQPLILLISLPGWWESAANVRISDGTAQGTALSASQQVTYVDSRFNEFFHSIVPMLTIPILMIFAVVLIILLFGYMHNKRSVDLFHALPVGRVPMLLGRWCAGISMLFLPMLVNFGIVAAIGAANGLSGMPEEKALGIGISIGGPPASVLGWLLLMTAAIFTFSMLITVCSGSIFDTAVTVLGICAGYPILFLASSNLAAMILPGLDGFSNNRLPAATAFSPYAAAFVPLLSSRAGIGFLVWWLVLTPLMLVGACLLYRRRKSEVAEDRRAFPAVKIIIRFLVTATAGVGLGIMMSGAGMWGFAAGAFFGSLVAHVVVEAVYSRGFRRLKQSMVWYAGFALCFLIFYGVLASGCFGYDTRVPNAADVASVSLSLDSSGPGCTIVEDENRQRLLTLSPTLSKPESISDALEANKNIEALYRNSGFPYSVKEIAGSQLAFDYHLKDGRTFRRAYWYYDKGFNHDSFNQIREKAFSIPEYVEDSDMVFYLQPEDIKNVDINTPSTKGENTYVPTAAQKQALLAALRADLLAGEINQEDDHNGSNPNLLDVGIEFNSNIVPQDPRLKALLGNYNGKINPVNASYMLNNPADETWQLVHRLKWAD